MKGSLGWRKDKLAAPGASFTSTCTCSKKKKKKLFLLHFQSLEEVLEECSHVANLLTSKGGGMFFAR